jgi:hypothetical protein
MPVSIIGYSISSTFSFPCTFPHSFSSALIKYADSDKLRIDLADLLVTGETAEIL